MCPRYIHKPVPITAFPDLSNFSDFMIRCQNVKTKWQEFCVSDEISLSKGEWIQMLWNLVSSLIRKSSVQNHQGSGIFLCFEKFTVFTDDLKWQEFCLFYDENHFPQVTEHQCNVINYGNIFR